jgi:hypothetical protein
VEPRLLRRSDGRLRRARSDVRSSRLGLLRPVSARSRLERVCGSLHFG